MRNWKVTYRDGAQVLRCLVVQAFDITSAIPQAMSFSIAPYQITSVEEVAIPVGA